MTSVVLDSVIGVPDEVLIQEVDGEAVLLNVESGTYYGLDEVGTSMWTALAAHGQVRPAYEALLQAYEVEEGRLREDLLAFVETLAGHGLVRVE